MDPPKGSMSQIIQNARQVKKKTINVTGKIKGTISYKILGKNGFGYDSIFIPNNYNKTFGEMLKSDKIKIDHRFIAFKNLKKKIKTL